MQKDGFEWNREKKIKTKKNPKEKNWTRRKFLQKHPRATTIEPRMNVLHFLTRTHVARSIFLLFAGAAVCVYAHCFFFEGSLCTELFSGWVNEWKWYIEVGGSVCPLHAIAVASAHSRTPPWPQWTQIPTHCAAKLYFIEVAHKIGVRSLLNWVRCCLRNEEEEDGKKNRRIKGTQNIMKLIHRLGA